MKALRRLVLAFVLVPAPGSVAAAQARDIDFAALRDETVKVMSEYLRINTTNPPGNELQSARFLQAFLAREGIEGQILDTVELGPGRANFYARLKGNDRRKLSLSCSTWTWCRRTGSSGRWIPSPGRCRGERCGDEARSI